MIITMKTGVSEEEIEKVVSAIKKNRLDSKVIRGKQKIVIAVIGIVGYDEQFVGHINSLAGVEEIARISKPYKLAAKEAGNGHRVAVGDCIFGDKEIFFMAGPCSVEDRKQMKKTARFLSDIGIKFLRAGAFKPRTNPRCFEGLGERGLEILAEIRDGYGFYIVTEILDTIHAELFAKYDVDVIQIGTRNMDNFQLLKAAGKLNKITILKRGYASTIEELLSASEYILDAQEKAGVILCERGIRTFEPATRNTLDISAVPATRSRSWLPIMIDPSHAAGKAEYVPSMTLAAIAAGADGILIEVHPNPQRARTDGAQSLDFKAFEKLYNQAKKVAEAIGRKVV